jgi:hypothetical protein
MFIRRIEEIYFNRAKGAAKLYHLRFRRHVGQTWGEKADVHVSRSQPRLRARSLQDCPTGRGVRDGH